MIGVKIIRAKTELRTLALTLWLFKAKIDLLINTAECCFYCEAIESGARSEYKRNDQWLTRGVHP